MVMIYTFYGNDLHSLYQDVLSMTINCVVYNKFTQSNSNLRILIDEDYGHGFTLSIVQRFGHIIRHGLINRVLLE